MCVRVCVYSKHVHATDLLLQKSVVYMEWLNDQLGALDLPRVDDISDSIANGVAVLKVLVVSWKLGM